jgi:hypothetical protein
MNEQLQDALTELLGKANNGIDNASNFLVAELPEVIQQLLLWHGVYNFVLFIGGLLLALAIVFADFKMYKVAKDWSDVDFKSGYLLVGSFGRIFLWAIVLVGMLNLEWLQIWIAPKVWLLEYAASLAK